MAQTQANAKSTPVATPATAAAGKRGRAKKGEEAFKVYYINAEGKESNRVAADTAGIKAVDKKGVSTVIKMDGLPEAVKNQLAFSGLYTFVTKPLKKDATNVIETVTNTIKSITEGTLFTKSGKSAGRAFDPDFWVSCAVRAMEIAVERKVQNAKLMTDANKKKLRADLESKTAQERNARIKQWMSNPIFVYAKKDVETTKAKSAVGSTDNPLSGLEF